MSLLTPGLVSITFRSLPPAEIVDLVARAGLVGIEWGGDIHVPHGDVSAAERVRELTESAGLTTVAYGSYYRVGPESGVSFTSVLDAASALGAPVIRVWAGSKGSADADERYLEAVAIDACRIANLAGERGIQIAFEYHGGTVADNAPATLALLARAAHPNLTTLWQPSTTETPGQRLAGLKALSLPLAHVHVFQWRGHDRLPLAKGESEWRTYLGALKSRGRPTSLLIEFVTGDDPEAFLADAATLRTWIEGR